MNLLKELWILILLYLIGELITLIIPSPLPGNVIGFVLMVIVLKVGIIKEHSITHVTNFLLNNLAILFIPGGVAILKVIHLFNGNILKLIFLIVITTILTMLSTAGTILLMEKLKR